MWDIIITHHTKPTIKTHILYYKYNAIATAIYYNPQSILVSFPINIDVFSARQRAILHISCNIGTRDLPDMYTLSPRACGPQAWV